MRTIKKEIRIFLAIWAFFLLGILVLAGVFLAHRMKNENKLNDAQVGQIGKPVQVDYNQYYHTK